MSEHTLHKKAVPPRAFGWMAEYTDERELLEAARKVRDSGYTRTDAFTPFPVHGIEDALGIKPSVLPWLVLCAGLTGMCGAMLMQWWMNAVNYPYIISGKPYFSWPAFIPVTFETTILFSAFTTFLGMIALNGLPRLSNPVFTNPKFDRATDDRFFLWVDSRDKYFNSAKVKGLLESTQPLSVDEVREDDSSTHVPKFLFSIAISIILLSFIPSSIVLRMRASKSESPRWHVFFDMDFQAKKKVQQTTTLFADGRVMRPPVAGTIARGDLEQTDPYYLGYDPEKTVAIMDSGDTRLVSYLQESASGKSKEGSAQSEGTVSSPDSGQPPAPKTADSPATPAIATESKSEKPKESEKSNSGTTVESASAAAAHVPSTPPASVAPVTATASAGPAGEVVLPWITEFPLPVDEALMKLGKRKFETNCAVCHGFAGNGDGLVSQRAFQLAQGYWVQPTSLHDDKVSSQPIGKIYYTISHGKGKMGSYGPVLTPKERWAVVLYVRALQRSRSAALADVPESMRAKLTSSPVAANENQ